MTVWKLACRVLDGWPSTHELLETKEILHVVVDKIDTLARQSYIFYGLGCTRHMDSHGFVEIDGRILASSSLAACTQSK